MTVPQIWRRMTGSIQEAFARQNIKEEKLSFYLNQTTEMESKGASKLREHIGKKSALFSVIGDPTGIALVNGHSYNGIR